VPAAAPLPANAQEWAGWYEAVAVRMKMQEFIAPLAMQHVSFKDGVLQFSPLGPAKQTFIPVSGLQFRYKPDKGPVEPVATAALLAPNSDGRFIFIGTTYKRIPTWLAIVRIALMVWFLLAVVSILLYAPFWIIGGFFKRCRRPAERMMRLWPLIAVLSLLAFVGLLVLSGNDAIARLGNLTFYSFGLTITTLLFAAASLAGAVTLWLARKVEIRRSVRWYSIAVTAALLIAVVYLGCFGVIGIRTWS
jgi:hypothetical protein